MLHVCWISCLLACWGSCCMSTGFCKRRLYKWAWLFSFNNAIQSHYNWVVVVVVVLFRKTLCLSGSVCFNISLTCVHILSFWFQSSGFSVFWVFWVCESCSQLWFYMYIYWVFQHKVIMVSVFVLNASSSVFCYVFVVFKYILDLRRVFLNK